MKSNRFQQRRVCILQRVPGWYEVKAEAQGFQTEVATAVNVDIAQRARLDFTLKVGMVSQQVEVSAHAEVMDTNTASLGTNYRTAYHPGSSA